MNLCKTCKHWIFDPACKGNWPVERYCAPVDPDTFEPMVMPFEVRECTHPEKTFCERPVEPNGFGVADGSTYMAVLMTASEFGCVRHEATQPERGHE